mgnify:CR=1 FL=1
MEKLKSLNLKSHLLTAISYMLPIVCGGGFLVAIGMALGGTNMYADGLIQGKFTFWDALATMGGAALGLLPLIIAVGIASRVNQVSHQDLSLDYQQLRSAQDLSVVFSVDI